MFVKLTGFNTDKEINVLAYTIKSFSVEPDGSTLVTFGNSGSCSVKESCRSVRHAIKKAMSQNSATAGVQETPTEDSSE